MGKFDGILICTDLDGTLLGSDKKISKENLDAISYFKAEGGYFTFITGRMPYYSKFVSDAIDPSAPFGFSNGGGLYDHITGEIVWKQPIAPSVIELVRMVDRQFPDVGIQLTGFHKAYCCKNTPYMERFRELTKLPYIECDYESFDIEMAKVLLGTTDENTMEEMIKALNEHPMASEFVFVRSSKTLYEIIPKGIGKGTAIEKLAEHLNLDISKTIAVGDYENDISMLKTAGIGIAVENAAEEAKNAADLITVSNDDHAIARIIYDLDTGAIKL